MSGDMFGGADAGIAAAQAQTDAIARGDTAALQANCEQAERFVSEALLDAVRRGVAPIAVPIGAVVAVGRYLHGASGPASIGGLLRALADNLKRAAAGADTWVIDAGPPPRAEIADELLTAVGAMRAAQRRYFRTRSTEALREARGLEQKVDRLLTELGEVRP